MYVSQTFAASQNQNARRAKARNGDRTSFRVPDKSAPTSTPAIQGGQTVAPLAALLAVQEVDQVQNDRRRAVQQGREILDLLDELKLALLSGTQSPDKVGRLKEMVNEVSVPPGDEKLSGILDAILLRAKVELAKRRIW